MVSCCYRNRRPQLIILRCISSCGFFLEKVIFPWEDGCFDAPPYPVAWRSGAMAWLASSSWMLSGSKICNYRGRIIPNGDLFLVILRLQNCLAISRDVLSDR